MIKSLRSISLFLSLSFFATFTVIAKESPGVMDNMEAQKIAEHSWVVLGSRAQPNPENQGFMNNPVFVITDKSVVVIDPGSSVQVGRALVKKIREKTSNPITHVFNSHVHGDHWLGNQALLEENAKVKIYAHPQMIEEAKAGEAEVWINLMKTLTEGATDGTEATNNDYAIFFSPQASGAGGLGGAFSLTNVTFPYTSDNDLSGVLSSNSYPVMTGEWAMYTIARDDTNGICAISTDFVAISSALL